MQKAVRVHKWQESGFAGVQLDDVAIPEGHGQGSVG